MFPINLDMIVTDDIEALKSHLAYDEDQDPEVTKPIFATTYWDEFPGKAGDLLMEAIQVVINPYDKHCKITYGVIAHEMYHVRSIMMRKIGQKASLKNDEFEAYLMNLLVDTFMEFYLECKENELEQGRIMELYTKTYEL